MNPRVQDGVRAAQEAEAEGRGLGLYQELVEAFLRDQEANEERVQLVERKNALLLESLHDARDRVEGLMTENVMLRAQVADLGVVPHMQH